MKDLAPEIAAYLFEDPDALESPPAAGISNIVARWPGATPDEITRALDIAHELLAARIAERQTEERALIEEARLTFGTQAAAELAARHLSK